ncbi:uridine kinase [Compostimonas suwonensis]|uniref:Uridine kinase n=1 Tax=Compostimonas suwonensis TaxID=1048394 RepID=A0A2M9BU97_9MICO|nr:uridine kinase [Compostimonas suwonensis]PJJ61519.1 uridine kinase [Compostimonas suwonensis]
MTLMSTPRVEFLRGLRAEIAHNYGVGRAVVAVDGAPGSGTAEFADDLAAVFREVGHNSFRASLEDFHTPRAVRYRHGRESAEAYYRDSYDYALLRRVLLDPYRMGGSTGFVTVAFDVRRDAQVEPKWLSADVDAMLVVDGPFLNRPQTRGLWDYSIFLDADDVVRYERLAASIGVDPDPDAPSNAKYREGWELYLADGGPRLLASAIVDDNDAARPWRVFSDSC